MAAHFDTEYELTQGSIRIAQLVGEPQAQVEAEWSGPFLQRSQSNEVNAPLRSMGRTKLHRSSSYNILQKKERIVHESPPKTPKLKLPSFNELGISGLHIRNKPPRGSGKDIRRCREPEDYFQRRPTRSQTSIGPSHPCSFGSAPLLTPPEDTDSLKWNRTVSQGNHCQQEETESTPRRVPRLFASSLTGVTQSTNDSGSPSRPVNSNNDTSSPIRSSRLPPDPELNEDGDDWLERAVQKTVGSAVSTGTLGQSVKIVSQAMPSPSDQATQPGSVFPVVINEISNQYSSVSTPPIEVFHAVPSDFSLRNLPTSPPTTPNTSADGDYFSQIFGSATVIQPHHNHDGTIIAHPPIASTFVRPRSSVSFSILERLIPPASAKEYTDMFSPRNSALADRLVELSPHGGTMIFVYPTKDGAESFRDELLGPILDPLLRSLVSLNSLYTDLGASLGRLSSVTSMFDFRGMVDKLEVLCRALSDQVYRTEARSRFEFLYAGRGKTHLPRELWTELFIKQERPRMRELLDRYWSRGKRLPRNTDVTSATMLREIIDGLERRSYGESKPNEEIEVGVFVIRRTSTWNT